MKEAMFGHLDVHLERWDSSYCLTLNEAGTYEHIFKILCDERPYNWIDNDRRITSAVSDGPPYIWRGPDSFEKSIATCFEIDPVRRPTSSELIE